MAVDPRVEQLRPMVEPALKSGQTASHGDCRSRRVEGTTVRSSSDVGGVLGSTVLGDHTDFPGEPDLCLPRVEGRGGGCVHRSAVTVRDHEVGRRVGGYRIKSALRMRG
jgi:hypothetical protein